MHKTYFNEIFNKESMWSFTKMFRRRMSLYYKYISIGLLGGSDDKESTCNVGDQGLIHGLGRYPGKGNGYPLQYSWLELDYKLKCIYKLED